MRLQRDGYEKLAAACKRALLAAENDEQRKGVISVAISLATMIKADAHAFNVPLFLDNCGVRRTDQPRD